MLFDFHKLLYCGIRYIENMKGGVILPSQGFLQVRAYASNAQLPLRDVAVTVTDAGDAAIAMRLTNRSGLFDVPIAIEVPELSAGQSPNTGVIPFSTVNLYARIEDYEEISIDNIQIFPNTVTVQNLELIPLSEFPAKWNKAESFDTPAQNL